MTSGRFSDKKFKYLIAFQQNLFAGNKLHNRKGGGQIFVEATQVLLMRMTMWMSTRITTFIETTQALPVNGQYLSYLNSSDHTHFQFELM